MSTPDITPFLLEGDRRRPDLKTINTRMAAFELLQLTLALAGPDWYFIGKTDTMDGDGKVTPAGFTPFVAKLTREDGQLQEVRIVGVSMDAAWHLPSQRQVKVIANSAANEPGPHDHGPARLTPYEIEPQYYRWHNPAVAQWHVAIPGGPIATPPEPPRLSIPDPGELMDEGKHLEAFYKSSDGLQRPEGLYRLDHQLVDWEGVGAWLLGIYLVERVKGASREEARAIYLAKIRESNEWKQKHPGA